MAKKRFKKGSKAAKAFMRKLRSMQGRKTGGKKRKTRSRKKAFKTRIDYQPSVKQVAMEKLNFLRNKGRKIAKSARIKPFFFTGRRGQQLIISEGDRMARKRSRKHTRRHVRHMGFDGRKRSRRSYRRSRRGLLMGGMGGGVKGITSLLMQGTAGAAGAVGSAYLANVLPLPASMTKFKPAIPLITAVLLMTVGKKIPMSKPMAFGAAMSGVLGFAHQFVPNLPALAGVSSAPELTTSDRMLLLGAPQSFGGAVQNMKGETSFTPASI